MYSKNKKRKEEFVPYKSQKRKSPSFIEKKKKSTVRYLQKGIRKYFEEGEGTVGGRIQGKERG